MRCGRSSSRTCRRTSSTARGPPISTTPSASAGIRSTSTASGPEDVGVSCRTRPFQIPLGALIPVRARQPDRRGLKNIGTTHITNGCYRLHPVEWNIGEAAGALADWSLGRQRSPEQVWRDPGETACFQRRLLEDGVPIAWIVDVPPGHRAFTAVQVLAATGAPVAPERLELVPAAPLSAAEWQSWGGVGEPPPTREAGAQRLLDVQDEKAP